MADTLSSPGARATVLPKLSVSAARDPEVEADTAATALCTAITRGLGHTQSASAQLLCRNKKPCHSAYVL